MRLVGRGQTDPAQAPPQVNSSALKLAVVLDVAGRQALPAQTRGNASGGNATRGTGGRSVMRVSGAVACANARVGINFTAAGCRHTTNPQPATMATRSP